MNTTEDLLVCSIRFLQKRLPILTCFFALILSGCSGSSDSGVSNSTSTDEISENSVVVDNTASDNTSSPIVLETVTDAMAEDTNGISDQVDIVEGQSPPASSASTRVVFDITVPAYMSNALQVRLEWGDLDTTAAWVRDETWVVSESLPIDTENTLLITFSDDNGAITLGSFEATFSTSSAESESLLITADQFDTNRWDNDNDGENNLNELIAGTNPLGGEPPEAAQVTLELVRDKTFQISWTPSDSAQFYRVLENTDGLSGFTQIGEDIDALVQIFNHRVPLYNRFNASYMVQACNSTSCTDSAAVNVSGTLEDAIGYFKASDADAFEQQSFGLSVSMSADGEIFAVKHRNRNIYIFERSSGNWQEQAILETTDVLRPFSKISMSADGHTVVAHENSGISVFERTGDDWEQTFISSPFNFEVTACGSQASSGNISLSPDGNTLAFSPTEGCMFSEETSEVVYIFVRGPDGWSQQATLFASNNGYGFGASISLSANGDKLVVGAPSESSSSTGINGDQQPEVHTQNITNAFRSDSYSSGAVYLFSRSGTNWQQEAYIKASENSRLARFGIVVEISANGETIAVGAAEATYIFTLVDSVLQEQTVLTASNASDANYRFGGSLSMSADGATLAVGADSENSFARGINGDQNNSNAGNSGAVYLFTRNNDSWQQLAYIKSSNNDPDSVECPFTVFTDGELRTFFMSGDNFGQSLDLSADGQTLAVSAPRECSLSNGIDADQADNSGYSSGAVYLY